jgi:hypothetical protein
MRAVTARRYKELLATAMRDFCGSPLLPRSTQQVADPVVRTLRAFDGAQASARAEGVTGLGQWLRQQQAGAGGGGGAPRESDDAAWMEQQVGGGWSGTACGGTDRGRGARSPALMEPLGPVTAWRRWVRATVHM